MKTIKAWVLSLGLFCGISSESFRKGNMFFTAGAISRILIIQHQQLIQPYKIVIYGMNVKKDLIFVLSLSLSLYLQGEETEAVLRNILLHHLPWFFHQSFLLLCETHISLSLSKLVYLLLLYFINFIALVAFMDTFYFTLPEKLL